MTKIVKSTCTARKIAGVSWSTIALCGLVAMPDTPVKAAAADDPTTIETRAQAGQHAREDSPATTPVLDIRVRAPISRDGLPITVVGCTPAPGSSRGASMYDPVGMPSDTHGCLDAAILDPVSGAVRWLPGQKGAIDRPVRSPDGKRLAFITVEGDRTRLAIQDEGGGTATMIDGVSPKSLAPFAAVDPTWSSDSKYLAGCAWPSNVPLPKLGDDPLQPTPWIEIFSNTPNADAPGREATPTARWQKKPTGWFIECDVFVADLQQRSAVTSLRNIPPIWMDAAPSGPKLAVGHVAGFNLARSARLCDVDRVDFVTGKSTPILRDAYPDGCRMSWAPDGQRLAYVDSSPEQGPMLIIVDENGGVLSEQSVAAPEYRSTLQPHDARSLVYWLDEREMIVVRDGGLWSAKIGSSARLMVTPVTGRVSSIVTVGGRPWRARNGDIAFTSRSSSTGETIVSRLDIRNGRVKSVWDVGGELQLVDGALDGSRVYGRRETAVSPPAIWSLDLESGARERVPTALADRRKELGGFHWVPFTDGAGVARRGALIAPAGRKKPYPTILLLYPFDQIPATTWNSYAFKDSPMLGVRRLVEAGYAVFFADIRMRTGLAASDIAANSERALTAAIDAGLVSRDRIGVLGHSFGGFSVMAFLERSRLAKAGVAASGVADWGQHYGLLASNGTDMWSSRLEYRGSQGYGEQGSIGKSLWEDPAAYIANSPIYGLDKVEAPVLLQAGTGDSTVPSSHSDRLFSGLRKLGKTVEYRRYDAEHMLTDGRMIDDFVNATIGWFDKYLPSSGGESASVVGGGLAPSAPEPVPAP